MRSYGSDQMLPKLRSDIGTASHFWHLPGKGGDIRSQFQNSSAKRAGRRHLKRLERRAGRKECVSYDD